jgi:hypothetical protein
MHLVKKFQEATEPQVHQDRIRAQQEGVDARQESEKRDRAYVRNALRKGVPAEEIENRLLRSTEFQRLNPEQDLLAYVRGLIDEESGSAHGMGSRVPNDPENLEPHESRGGIPTPVVNAAVTSQLTAQQYIHENFEPSDWLAVVVRNRLSGDHSTHHHGKQNCRR